MNPSRRDLLLAGTASAALLTGCVAAAPQSDDDEHLSGGDDSDQHDADDDCESTDLPTIDSPPHEPTRPAGPDGLEENDEWDDHFLGEGMDTDSPVAFTPFNVRYRDPPADAVADGTNRVISAELFTNRELFEEALAPVGDDADEIAEEIDFDDELVLAIFSGFGSSSIGHEWVRLEDNCEEVHLHGYYRKPYLTTDDVAARTSAVILERPDDTDLERAWVSLTVNEDERANVTTDDSIVDLSDDRHQDDSSDDAGDELPGPIEDRALLPVNRAYAGDWWTDTADGPGIAIALRDAEEVTALVDVDEDVDAFLDATDFAEDVVYYLELAGPNACYSDIEVSDLVIIANGEYSLQASVRVVDRSEDDESCAQVMTFPAVLLRVEADVSIEDARIRMTDGWGNEERLSPIDIGEFAQE